MNICMISRYLPVHVRGGMEIHANDLARGLVKRGHAVTIITAPHPQYGCWTEDEGALRIHYLKSMPTLTRQMFYSESRHLFAQLHQKQRFDILHSQSTLAMGCLRLTSKECPLVVTMHGTAINEFRSAFNGGLRFRHLLAIPLWLKSYLVDDQMVVQNASKVVAVSNELGKDIQDQYRISSKRLVVVPNGINTNLFRPWISTDMQQRFNVANRRVLLSVGSITRQKGLGVLLAAVQRLKEYYPLSLFVIGKGPAFEYFQQIAQRYSIADLVRFLGGIPHDELPSFYNLADVFVFPTLREEAMPLVVPEAMACGRPIVVSRIGGIRSTVEHGKDGLLVEPNDPAALAMAIREVLDNKELAEALGKRAREKALSEFSVDKMVERTLNVYKVARGADS